MDMDNERTSLAELAALAHIEHERVFGRGWRENGDTLWSGCGVLEDLAQEQAFYSSVGIDWNRHIKTPEHDEEDINVAAASVFELTDGVFDMDELLAPGAEALIASCAMDEGCMKSLAAGIVQAAQVEPGTDGMRKARRVAGSLQERFGSALEALENIRRAATGKRKRSRRSWTEDHDDELDEAVEMLLEKVYTKVELLQTFAPLYDTQAEAQRDASSADMPVLSGKLAPLYGIETANNAFRIVQLMDADDAENCLAFAVALGEALDRLEKTGLVRQDCKWQLERMKTSQDDWRKSDPWILAEDRGEHAQYLWTVRATELFRYYPSPVDINDIVGSMLEEPYIPSDNAEARYPMVTWANEYIRRRKYGDSLEGKARRILDEKDAHYRGLEQLQIAVEMGLLDPETLQIAKHPKKERRYCEWDLQALPRKFRPKSKTALEIWQDQNRAMRGEEFEEDDLL